MSLDLRALDSIADVVPLTIINVTFTEASKCDQLSTQVRKIDVLRMDECIF